MCLLCKNDASDHNTVSPEVYSRRNLFKAMGVLTLGSVLGSTLHAEAKGNPPKPDNVLNPDQALKRLVAGNTRYVKANSLQINVAKTRAALSTGQNPYACLVSCADSRVSPELCFDEERGDLFVTRVAGNFVNTDILASLEYAVAVLGAPLIMVLGHTSCGAIDAAVKAYTQNSAYPGHIQALTTALAPAVREATKTAKPDGLVAAATVENIRLNVNKLTESNPIISERVKLGTLKIVGGLYDLKTGRVNLV